MNKAPEFPIDIVYLYVDNTDPAWQAKLSKFQKNANKASNNARFTDNDELRYSLRSVDLYAPWVNKIYIVTDNQCPHWLNTENPRIQVIDHSQILPGEVLPLFNSMAIENAMYKIPGLSEHFIYGNDDMFFAQSVTPGTFFLPDGRAIARLTRFNRKKALNRDLYARVIYEMQNIIYEAYGKQIFLAPHHNFDAYRKSDFLGVKELAPERWEETFKHRFRTTEDISRSILALHQIAKGGGVLRKIGRFNNIKGLWGAIKAVLTNSYATDSRCIPLWKSDYDAIFKKYNPLMFCMNDEERATDDDRRRMREFLQRKFPDKSSFEK